MKIQFNPDLDFQADAVSSVVDLFEGQETCQTNFTVGALDHEAQMGLLESSLGIGNRLKLLDEDILANLAGIQLRNGLKPSTVLGDLNFTVEMETGTGKTYVYLRSVFELNLRYGFTKFIVVVPSIAIKEGTYKALQMTDEHFKGLYDNVRFDYFVYDSQKLGQVRNFATSDCIQIMVINIDAFRRSFTDPRKESDKANIIHRPHDRMSGARPIEFIQSTNPIVIIDEPQSVDTTAKSAEAIASLNPLCTFRYSATHKDKHHQIYRLDSVDAYERKLVKQIEVAGITVADSHNSAYVRLVNVDNKKGISAQIEYDAISGGQIKRKKRKVKTGTDLVELSGGRDIYDGYIIEEIYCVEGEEYVSFTGTDETVSLGQTIGEVDQDQYKRLQIRKTVEEHLDKELRLGPKNIKVLSLFFIDRVANYRAYDDDGNSVKGKYAEMFEEEYMRAIEKPKYKTLFDEVDLKTAADGVHNGYFAQDKKKDSGGKARLKESTTGKTVADEGAYQLIMRDKEKLLSFESKLKFIFSHSALREGWDNPNVFQICTLNESTSVMKKRQEIGRGLRICVNQDGERVYGFETNTLTVMANESYEDFAKALQKEIEEDTGITFSRVEHHLFANISVIAKDGERQPLGVDASNEVWEHLKDKGYIDSTGKVTDKLKKALKENTLDLPYSAIEQAEQIGTLLRKVAGDLNVKNADNRKQVKINKERFLGEEFKALWDRIKFKTTYRLSFDTEALVRACAKEIKDGLESRPITKARFQYRKSRAEISRGGVEMGEASQQAYNYDAEHMKPPDIVSFLQNETNLTRRSIVEILRQSGRLDDFKRNPNMFIERVSEIIKKRMQRFIVDGIKYHRIGDEVFYGQELFKDEELFGYISGRSENMVSAEKAVYDHVVYDSDIEREFAGRLEKSEDVKVYAKLPGWFKIESPLGTYNPDWAVLVERDDVERLFFIAETKGSLFTDALRPIEEAKIKCGRAHFEALDSGVNFTVANNYDSFEGAIDAMEPGSGTEQGGS